MILALIDYTLPVAATRQAMLDKFQRAEAKFRGLAGLERKYFCYDETTGTGFSAYVWTRRADAEAFFSPQFVAGFETSFGAKPTIRYVDALMVLDNKTDTVGFPAAE
jgi:hypothetical protein